MAFRQSHLTPPSVQGGRCGRAPDEESLHRPAKTPPLPALVSSWPGCAGRGRSQGAHHCMGASRPLYSQRKLVVARVPLRLRKRLHQHRRRMACARRSDRVIPTAAQPGAIRRWRTACARRSRGGPVGRYRRDFATSPVMPVTAREGGYPQSCNVSGDALVLVDLRRFTISGAPRATASPVLA